MKKASAMFLVLIFIFSLASCGKKNSETDTSSTEKPPTSANAESSVAETAGTESSATEATNTNADISDTSVMGTTIAATEPADRTTDAPITDNRSTDITIPENIDGIIALYNKAVAETPNLKRTAFTRSLKTCLVEIGSYFQGDIAKDPLTTQIVDVNDTAHAANDLPQLNAGMVSNASGSISGDSIILNIQLKTLVTTDPKHGDGGYMGALTDKEIRALVLAAAKGLGGDVIQSVEILTTEGKLTNGSLVVKINKTTGQIQSVQFHGEQEESGTADVKGKLVISLTVRGAKANIKIVMDAQYSA